MHYVRVDSPASRTVSRVDSDGSVQTTLNVSIVEGWSRASTCTCSCGDCDRAKDLSESGKGEIVFVTPTYEDEEVDWKPKTDFEKMLKYPDSTCRCQALQTLAKLPYHIWTEHTSEVLKLSKDNDEHVRSAACLTLSGLSPVDLSSVELEEEPLRKDFPQLAELQQMHREAVKLTNLVVEARNGILVVSSDMRLCGQLGSIIVNLEAEIAAGRCPELPHDMNLQSKVFKLSPEGVTFREPVRLLIPVQAGANIGLHGSAGHWEVKPAIFGGNHMEVKLDHFSYVLAARTTDDAPSPRCQSPWMQSFCTFCEPTCGPVWNPTEASHRRHMLISARFNRPERLTYLKAVKESLEKRRVLVDMVDVGAGESFGDPTMRGLYYARMMAAFCTDDYGALTGARFETFHELRYAWEKEVTIVPVRLCDQYPPKPPDEAGRIQNDFVLSQSVVRIEGRDKSPDYVAEELAKAWQRGS